MEMTTADPATQSPEEPDDPVVERGLRLLREGRRGFNHARYLESVDAHDESEEKLRQALETLRSATNWLEDSEHFEAAHEALDQAGQFRREHFSCLFTFEDGVYYQDCPVALAHNRVGMSPAMVIGAAQCSICKQDPEECAHITGRVYDGQRCIRIITEVKEILEISLVARPAQPDARITRMSVDTDRFRRALGPAFRVGMPINCDRCLSNCDGVSRVFEEFGNEPQEAQPPSSRFENSRRRT
jgi:hypothetical protein